MLHIGGFGVIIIDKAIAKNKKDGKENDRIQIRHTAFN